MFPCPTIVQIPHCTIARRSPFFERLRNRHFQNFQNKWQQLNETEKTVSVCARYCFPFKIWQSLFFFALKFLTTYTNGERDHFECAELSSFSSGQLCPSFALFCVLLLWVSFAHSRLVALGLWLAAAFEKYYNARFMYYAHPSRRIGA